MIRLLIALALVGLAYYFLVDRQTVTDEEPEVLYRETTEKARGVESQVQDQAERQRQAIDGADR